MKCPKCKIEMKIKSSKNVIDLNGETPKLYRQSTLTCRNEACGNHNKDVHVVKNELPLSKDGE